MLVSLLKIEILSSSETFDSAEFYNGVQRACPLLTHS